MSRKISIADGHGYPVEFLDANDGTVSLATTVKHGKFIITAGSAKTYTLANPVAGQDDGATLTIVAATAFAHVISVPTKLNTGATGPGTATLGGAIGDGITLIAYAGKWLVAPGGKTNATVA